MLFRIFGKIGYGNLTIIIGKQLPLRGYDGAKLMRLGIFIPIVIAEFGAVVGSWINFLNHGQLLNSPGTEWQRRFQPKGTRREQDHCKQNRQ